MEEKVDIQTFIIAQENQAGSVNSVDCKLVRSLIVGGGESVKMLESDEDWMDDERVDDKDQDDLPKTITCSFLRNPWTNEKHVRFPVGYRRVDRKIGSPNRPTIR